MSANTLEQVNNIGAETAQSGAPPISPRKKGNPKLQNWLLGFSFSWLPVLSWPLAVLVRTGDIIQFLSLIFVDASIIYIGVSLLVSAMNDLGPNDNGRRRFYTFILAAAAMVYAIINFMQKSSDQNTVNVTVITIMNLVFLVTPLICGLHQYLQKTEG